YGDGAALEGNQAHVVLDPIVERQHTEEEIHWRDAPTQPDLAVSFGAVQLLSAELDTPGHRGEHITRPPRIDKDVHVHVARASRLQYAVAERDRAADRVRNPGAVKAVVHSEQLIAELAHRLSLIKGGYSSSPRPLNGSEPARSRTMESTFPECSSEGPPSDGVRSSCRPALRAMRAMAATDG